MTDPDAWADKWKKPEDIPPLEGVQPFPEAALRIVKPIMKWFSRFNVQIYQLTGGRVLGSFNGSRCCLVTMTGRKSGKKRTIPLIHLPHGDDVILVASQGGMDVHPIWYRNLLAHPDIEIQEGSIKRKMRARRATDEEKRELWPHLLTFYKDFDEYQTRTDRNIPVMICTPV